VKKMAITQTRDGRWVVYYRDPAVHKHYIRREPFGRGPEAEQRALARNRDLGLSAERRRHPAADGPMVAELARDYAEAHQFATERARWQHELRMDSRVLPFFGAIPAARLADSDLDRYIKTRRAADARYSTIRRELVDLKALLNWAHKRRPPLIPFNPVRDYRLPKEDLAIIMPPTADELAAILAAAPEHLQRIIKLAYYLGLRPGPVECYRLQWENVDWNAATILITGAKKGGGDRRSVPIHPDLLPVMQEWFERDKAKGIPWIIHWAGQPPDKISTVWAKTLATAKITRRLRPYDLRHLFVTQALERGADIKSLSDVVGSRPETLMRFYQHVTTTMHRRTISMIPPLGDTEDTDKN
jgi:integrase